jgi:hypothetical protein
MAPKVICSSFDGGKLPDPLTRKDWANVTWPFRFCKIAVGASAQLGHKEVASAINRL